VKAGETVDGSALDVSMLNVDASVDDIDVGARSSICIAGFPQSNHNYLLRLTKESANIFPRASITYEGLLHQGVCQSTGRSTNHLT